jgi:GNAT superfamily N-acetyltransferase
VELGDGIITMDKKIKRAETTRTLRRNEETAHFNMLNLCYAPWGSLEEWTRRYIHHPDFDVTENVVVVEENSQWAGGGTGWFREALLKNNKSVRVYGAGDLYVHPNHRGKGIYSTAMRSLNQLAQEKGAALGFAYPSIYRLPAMALPKYGFVEVFYPTTQVLVLNPEKFFRFLTSRAKKAFFSEKFNGIRLNLTVSFNTPKGKREITGKFMVENGQVQELPATSEKEQMDLAVKTEAGVLLRLVSGYYLGKRRLLIFVLKNLIRRRLRVRFSMKFLKSFLGL